jgi:hypothetical protein
MTGTGGGSRPLNYTTAIGVEKTAGECQALLGAAGASSVAVHYEDRQPAGLSFSLDTPHGTRAFTLPVNISGAHQVLLQAQADGQFAALRKKQGAYTSPEHAARVAWRVTRDWLEATLALVAAKMATIDEVMLPYLHIDGEGRTLAQAYRKREQAAIEVGRPQPREGQPR